MRESSLGYAILPDCIAPRVCDELLSALDDVCLERSRAGARHLMTVPAVASLANRHALTSIAREWLGGAAIPFRATLFEKSTSTNWLIPWHQDTALPLEERFDREGWGPWSQKGGVLYAHAPSWALSRVVALRVHLDPSHRGNGPLRVIPGSHADGVLTDQQVHQLVAAKQQVECTTGCGGIVVMRPLLIHASSKARSAEPRRVLHIEYADSLGLSEGATLAVA